MFLNPFPDITLIDDLYAQDDYFDAYHATTEGIKSYIDGMRSYNSIDTNIINIIHRYKEHGRLLDIGCAGGRFLLNARNAGFEVYGIEPNKKMADFAVTKLGLKVSCGKLSELNTQSGSFDIIHLSDVLEHLPEIRNTMEIIKGLLAKNGIVVIQQPMLYNNSFFNALLQINMLLKSDRYAPNPPAHLWEFNHATLPRFLNKSGFEIVQMEVRETRAKPLSAYGQSVSIKNRISLQVKNISCFLSNLSFLKWLKLGDRAIVICKKRETV
ncbi:MAG TPA: hypothetical protein DEQ77_06625 [Candidatus Omnitrophica bacterium]|nr:hypothetical protein [Candidatus Omnitrophota bacterium]